MRMARLLRLAAAIGLLCLSGNEALSKDGANGTTFSGVIVDKAGRIPISDAHVWIHEQSGESEFAAQPNRAGQFSIQLADGYYDVMVGAPAFAPFCKKIWVRSGSPVTLNITLKPDEETLQKGKHPVVSR
jgi:Carboxypeptidase regulatory-like domain